MVANSRPNSKTILIDLINLLRGKEEREKVLAKVATNISHSSLQEQHRTFIRWKIILPVIFGVALITLIIASFQYINFINQESCSAQDLMTSNATKKGSPVDIAVNPNTDIVYVANSASKDISAIDCSKQHRTVDTISTDGNVAELTADPTSNKVYAVIPATNSILVIDSNNGFNLNDTIELFGKLQKGKIDEIMYDRPEYNKISTIKTAIMPNAVDVNTSSGKIYIADSQSNAIHTIDETSAEKPILNNTLNKMKIQDIALNSKTGKLYVSGDKSDVITIINPEDGTAKNITGLGNSSLPNSLFINPNKDKIYVINKALPKVSVIDGERDRLLKNIPIGTGPIDIAVDYSNNVVYVASQVSNTVSIIDGNKDQVVKILPIALASNNRLESVAVNSETSEIHQLYLGFAHDDGSGSISLRNPADYKNTYIQVSQFPINMALNPNTSKLYVAEYNNNSVAVIDTKTDTLKDISLGESNLPFNIAVNPNTEKIYVTNSITNSVTDNNHSSVVSVINGKDDKISHPVLLPFPVSDIAIDPSSNKTYVTGGYKNYSYLSVIYGQNDTVMKTIPLKFSPSDIAVNPNTNNIYLANNKDWSITVIQGKGDNILNNTSNISLSIPPESIVIDPDPAIDRIYVTSYSKPTPSKEENSFDPKAITIPRLTQIQVIDGSNNTARWGGKTMKLDPKLGDIILSFNPKSHDLLATSLSTDTIQSWNMTQAENAIQKSDGNLYGLKQVTAGAGIDYTHFVMNDDGNKVYIANPGLNAIKVEKVENVSHRVF